MELSEELALPETFSPLTLISIAAVSTAISVGSLLFVVIKRDPKPLSRLIAALTGAVIVVLLASVIYVAVVWQNASYSARQPMATILSPQNGVVVQAHQLEVTGTASNLPEGDTIWTLVRLQPESQSRYYPSQAPCSEPDDARIWHCTVYLPHEPSRRGVTVVISVALADGRGSNTLARTPESGVAEVPLGVEIADEVNVILG
jgi:hypothetical protein